MDLEEACDLYDQICNDGSNPSIAHQILLLKQLDIPIPERYHELLRRQLSDYLFKLEKKEFRPSHHALAIFLFRIGTASFFNEEDLAKYGEIFERIQKKYQDVLPQHFQTPFNYDSE
ncbi:MAG: hypothetical protein ABIH72_00440 [archaeon]